MKKFCLAFAGALIMLAGGTVFGASSGGLDCETIEYLTESGDKVTTLDGSKTIARVAVKNNTDSPQQPAAVVASYESGKLNGIWYNTTDSELQSGESGIISVEFYPVTANSSTEIKTVVVDSMKKLEAQSEIAEMLSDSVGLKRICVDGKELSEYDDSTDTYLIETNQAFSEISAEPADGGTEVETIVSAEFPSVSKVNVTSSMGKRRTIRIVAYNDKDQLKNLIPVTTKLTSPQAYNGTGGANEDGSYTIIGKAGDTSAGKHLRYVFGTIPADLSFENNIVRFDVDITADEYYETLNSGKSRIFVDTSDGIQYNTTYMSTRFEQGETYHLKLIFDTERNCHIYLNDEYASFKMKSGTGTGIKGVQFGQSCPADTSLANVLTFRNASCTVYPPEYSLIINGEPSSNDNLPAIVGGGKLTVSKRGECTVTTENEDYVVTKKPTNAEQYSINIEYAGGASFEAYEEGVSIQRYIKQEMDFVVSELQTGVQIKSSLDSGRINLPALDAGTYHVSVLNDLAENKAYVYVNNSLVTTKETNSGTLSKIEMWLKDSVSEEKEVIRIKNACYTVYSPQAVLRDILESM